MNWLWIPWGLTLPLRFLLWLVLDSIYFIIVLLVPVKSLQNIIEEDFKNIVLMKGLGVYE